MRSPSKSVTKRLRDAESDLNLPPGFRFHPTDEELIVHYLRRKSQSTPESLIVPPIIANVDLYKHDPWQLPEMALFGTTEWYFFTARDRKYPNGSRPNRAAGNGYWKATGADKHIKSKSDPNTTIGIKKSLVFYAGKGINGIKTNWIMHEYRLVVPNPNMISKLDDWVLCRLYNKKNNPKEMIIKSVDDNIHHNQDLHRASQLDESCKENSGSNDDYRFDSFEYSDCESLSKVNMGLVESLMKTENLDDDNAWLECLSLEDLHHCLEALLPNNDIIDICEPPIIYQPNQQ